MHTFTHFSLWPKDFFFFFSLFSDLPKIETPLPEIVTAQPEIKTALPEIKTALLEVETALPEIDILSYKVENNYQPNKGLVEV